MQNRSFSYIEGRIDNIRKTLPRCEHDLIRLQNLKQEKENEVRALEKKAKEQESQLNQLHLSGELIKAIINAKLNDAIEKYYAAALTINPMLSREVFLLTYDIPAFLQTVQANLTETHDYEILKGHLDQLETSFAETKKQIELKKHIFGIVINSLFDAQKKKTSLDKELVSLVKNQHIARANLLFTHPAQPQGNIVDLSSNDPFFSPQQKF